LYLGAVRGQLVRTATAAVYIPLAALSAWAQHLGYLAARYGCSSNNPKAWRFRILEFGFGIAMRAACCRSAFRTRTRAARMSDSVSGGEGFLGIFTAAAEARASASLGRQRWLRIIFCSALSEVLPRFAVNFNLGSRSVGVLWAVGVERHLISPGEACTPSATVVCVHAGGRSDRRWGGGIRSG
jgi:hypothetical protein